MVDMGHLVGDPIKGGGSVGGGNMNTEAFEEAIEVACPADGDRDSADAVFENEVPADNPGHQFAECRIRISISTTGDRYGGGHLGVAQAGEGAGDRADDERKDDGRAGVRGGRVAGQDEDAGADDAADADHHQIGGGEGTFQRPVPRGGGFTL